MDSIIDTLSDFFDDCDDVIDISDTHFDISDIQSFTDTSVASDLHTDHLFDSFRDFSDSHNISFHGKSVDDLIDQHKTISIQSAGGGGTYKLDVYKDEYGSYWVSRHNGKVAECIKGVSQVDLGPNFDTCDIKKKI